MPYELLANGGPVVALIIFLGFLLKTNADKDKKRAEGEEQLANNYKKLVEDVMENAQKERSMLIDQLDKYNSSLKEISECIKVIPVMQKDIEQLKQNCN